MVTNNVCALFPGQGAQYPKMGLDFISSSSECRKLLQDASSIVGFDIYDRLTNANEIELARTDLQQVVITLVNLLSLTKIKEMGIVPNGTVGFSLGEFSSYFASGVLTMPETLALVASRGKIMMEECDKLSSDGKATGMAAILGLPEENVASILSTISDVWPANFNAPTQTVISGTEAALALAEDALKNAGAKRVIRLKVTGPFHSPLLARANERFMKELCKVSFADPVSVLFSAVSGERVYTSGVAAELISKQMIQSVKWTKTERSISTFGFTSLLETGPGKTLAGLWKSSGFDGQVLGAGTIAECDVLSSSKEQLVCV